MKYLKILAFLFVFAPFTAMAQESPAPTNDQMEGQDEDTDSTTAWEYVKERIFFGGTGGASFGNITYVNLSPLVGLRITPKFSTGLGATYVFYKNKYYNNSTSVYGGRVFSRYYFLDMFIAHGEFELLNAEYYDQDESRYDRRWVPALPLGGGIRQSFGNHGQIEVLVLMDLLYKPSTSVYSSPLRLNFGILF